MGLGRVPSLSMILLAINRGLLQLSIDDPVRSFLPLGLISEHDLVVVKNRAHLSRFFLRVRSYFRADERMLSLRAVVRFEDDETRSCGLNRDAKECMHVLASLRN